MTEQPDLKARLWKAAHDHATEKGGFLPGDTIFAEAASRITDLEAERDGPQETLTDWHDRAQAAESRLALAEKVVEAGRKLEFGAYPAHGSGLVCIVEGPLDEFTSALTAYAENTSSNDLTTGEDDA